MLHSVSFILLLIFTGARKELARATWDDWHGDYIELKEHKSIKMASRKILLNSQSRSVIQVSQGAKENDTWYQTLKALEQREISL